MDANVNCELHQNSSQVRLLHSMAEQEAVRQRAHCVNKTVRPCYYLLLLLGMWRPTDGCFHTIWQIYKALVHLIWLASLVGILCLQFVHHDFGKMINAGELLNSFPTCLNLLCPYVFTAYYFKHGQFTELVFSVQTVSEQFDARLQKISCIYTVISLMLWALGSAFFIVHWSPFFSHTWHYVAYVTIVVYTTGWWAAWSSVYGFVCQVHTLQIDQLVEAIASKDDETAHILHKHQQLQNSLERTQRDFNVIISFALVYHTVDIIVFSFAYFDASFGSNYKLWQYIGGVTFDLVSIVIKLLPPALVASKVHSIVTQAAKRCHVEMTPLATKLPVDDLHFFQYAALCEPDMGLKILGICITVQLTGTILMTIATLAVSFVAFVVPRIK